MLRNEYYAMEYVCDMGYYYNKVAPTGARGCEPDLERAITPTGARRRDPDLECAIIHHDSARVTIGKEQAASPVMRNTAATYLVRRARVVRMNCFASGDKYSV